MQERRSYSVDGIRVDERHTRAQSKDSLKDTYEINKRMPGDEVAIPGLGRGVVEQELERGVYVVELIEWMGGYKKFVIGTRVKREHYSLGNYEAYMARLMK